MVFGHRTLAAKIFLQKGEVLFLGNSATFIGINLFKNKGKLFLIFLLISIADKLQTKINCIYKLTFGHKFIILAQVRIFPRVCCYSIFSQMFLGNVVDLDKGRNTS